MDELTRDRSAMSLEAANREVYLLLKEGIKVSVPDTDSTPGKGHTSSGLRPPSPQRGEGNGGQKTERVRVIDWEHPANNDFLLVSQFSVTGALGMRTRGYVNHLLYRRRNSRLTPGAPSGLVSPQTMKTYLLTLVYVTVAFSACAQTNETGFVPIFDGQSLTGWHVSAKTGHSAASKNASGGKWVVEDGAIVGSQDIPANGGLVITDQKYSDFEVKLEMKNDFGPDSGLFLRSTEDGRAWQAMIDYHAGGNLMGIYGEGLGGKPHVRNYSFTDKVTEIDPKKTGEPPTPLPVLPSAWPSFWRHGQWNELRARIVNNPPHITTWINGVKIMEWQETEVRHPNEGGIALQVHGGGDYTKQFVRYRKIQVKELKGGEKEQ